MKHFKVKYPKKLGMELKTWAICNTGDAHAELTDNKKKVTCPYCLKKMK